MLESFIKYANREGLIEPQENILLGISGGLDSIVMHDLFNKSNIKYAIAHCNFGLRGDESDEDEIFVRELAKDNNVEIHTKKFDTKNYAIENKISIQMAARKLRVEWFEQLIKECDYVSYATAHHKDDQIETFFVNLLRSTGISGLHGILPQKDKLIHPMLFSNREEITNYALKNKLAFRQDSSNLKKDYLRNKIRHDLLLQLKNINPDYAEILTNNISRFRQAEAIYKKEIERAKEKLIIKEKDGIKIPISKLLQLDPIETYLYEMVSPFNFNISDVNDIVKSFDASSGKQFLSSTHRIIKDRDFLILTELNNPSKKDNRYSISMNCVKVESPINLIFEHIEKTEKIDFPANNDIAFFDFHKLEFPLSIRKWEKGDFFNPIGMNHKKLLSDFFIDQKLSILEKENTWLLTSNNKIVWIIGLRIDNRFKITDSTRKILKIYRR